MRAPLRMIAVERTTLLRLAFGAGMALVGVAFVEAALFFGLRPLSPVGIPGVGLLVGTALGGGAGLAGAAIVVELYYLFNFVYHYRFPEFYSSSFYTVLWVSVFAALAFVILFARPRLLRLASAEAELATRRKYEAALRESEQRLQVITNNVPALVAYVDAERRYRFHNRAYEEWFGLRNLDGRTVHEVWGEERSAMLKPNMERALRGERVTYDYALSHGGVERHMLANYVPDLDANGRARGFFVLASDITALASARDELRKEQARLEAALDGSSVALWDTDLCSGRVYLSEAWSGIVGTPRKETIATTEELVGLLHPDDVEAVRRASLEAVKGLRANYALEHRVRTRGGEWRWIISRGRVTERDASGRALRMIGTNVDITERRRMEEAIQSAAQIDVLTGLANRALFDERLKLAAARCRRQGGQLAVLYLDLDRFKQVNDSLGHAAGDVLLKDFAARLRQSVRATDTVARFGGDEFVLLLEDVKESGNAVAVAEKIIAESRQPLSIEGRRIVATASIGIAYGTGMDEENMVKRADAALYQAKGAGRDRYSLAS
ncbi:MAG TPA: diguanylate cyclase [Burkholderiales bacterium]|nr:diguanylate cyclase [Burkholderiales bacterium]